MPLVNPESNIKNGKWLPDMDLNHDKQIQSLLCYRYTIGQGNVVKLKHFRKESRNCGSRIDFGELSRAADCGLSGNAASATRQSPIRNPKSEIRN